MNELLRQPWWAPVKGKSKEESDRLRAGWLLNETSEIEQHQRSWHELNLWNATLYSNRELVGFNWGCAGDAARELWPTNLHTENLIEEIGDAMMSKASSSPIRPALKPTGNSWAIDRAVKSADQFVAAAWTQTASEEACVRAFLDGYISGLGCVRAIYDEDLNTLSVEPVFFDNVVVDNRECLNRQPPRTIRFRMVLPRASIEAKYGETLGKLTDPYVQYRKVGDGYEVLVEAFRKPDALGKGGRHTITCCGVLLVDEEWKHDWIPVEFFHYREQLSGFFGPSGVESLVPYQVRQNGLNDAIEETQDIVSHPRIIKHANSQINIDEWDGAAGRFLNYVGERPEPFVWATDLPTLLNERERNKAAAFSHAGMSEWFAHADAPQQVRYDSSAAVREGRNMEDSRHLRLWTRFQDFRLRVAKMLIKVLGTYEGAKNYSAVYQSKALHISARKVTFAAVKALKDDEYSWSLDASSAAMDTPAARRELLAAYASRTGQSEEATHYMITNPNLELEEELETSSYEDIHRHIELMENGEYERPTEVTNLVYGLKKVVANLHRLKKYTDDDEPTKVKLRNAIENHVKWLTAASSIQQNTVAMSQMVPYQPTQGVLGTSAAAGAPAPPM